MISFQMENWDSFWRDDARPRLTQEHYQEFSEIHEYKMGHNPRVQLFELMASTQSIFVVTARRDGDLVGYCVLLLMPHLHHGEALCAWENSFHLTESERGNGLNGTGAKFIVSIIGWAKKLGVRRLYWTSSSVRPTGGILEKLGARKLGEEWAVWLEDWNA